MQEVAGIMFNFTLHTIIVQSHACVWGGGAWVYMCVLYVSVFVFVYVSLVCVC